jgi:hypothetical protein
MNSRSFAALRMTTHGETAELRRDGPTFVARLSPR